MSGEYIYMYIYIYVCVLIAVFLLKKYIYFLKYLWKWFIDLCVTIYDEN